MSILDKKAYNPRELGPLDKKLRGLVDSQYEFCQYKCIEKGNNNLKSCKDQCVRDVIVPFRFLNHMGRDQEDNLYKKCLAEKFPDIKQEDYLDCTNQIQRDRIKVLGMQFTKITESILNDLH